MKRLLLGLMALVTLSTSAVAQYGGKISPSQAPYQAPYQAPQTYHAPPAPVYAAPASNSVTYTYNITYSQLPQAQGSSLYGYPGQMSNPADIYGSVNLGVNLDMISRITAQQSSDASANIRALNNTISQIHSDQKDLAAQYTRGQALVALTLANAEQTRAQTALAEKLEAGGNVKVETSYKVEGTKTVEGNGQVVPPPPAPGKDPTQDAAATQATAPNLQQIRALFTAKCVSCHNPDKKEGKLDLSNVSALTQAQVDTILIRVSHPDPAKRMPLAKDGTPGQPLNLSELKLLYKSVQ